MTAFFPEEYVDEMMPPDRPSPEAWIVDFDGRPALDNGWGDDFPRPLADGELVKFVRRIDYGKLILTLTAETATLAGVWAPGAELVCVDDCMLDEAPATSLEEIEALLRSVDADPDDYRLAFYTFEPARPYLFDAATRTFRKLPGLS